MSSTYPVSSAHSPPTTRSRSSRRCAAGRWASRAPTGSMCRWAG